AEEDDLDEADALREQAGRHPRIDADHRGNAEEQPALPGNGRQRQADRLARSLEQPPEPAGGRLLRVLRAGLHVRLCTSDAAGAQRTVAGTGRLDGRKERRDGRVVVREMKSAAPLDTAAPGEA